MDCPPDIPRFEAPLIFHERYLDFIRDNQSRLHAVHFSLHAVDLPDARYRFEDLPPDTLRDSLIGLSGVRKYALLNSCFHHPDAYFKPEVWEAVNAVLSPLVEADSVDGVVFSDLYFLNAFSDALPGLAEHLEAIPSINFNMDTWDKCSSVLNAVSRTRFRPPSKINLDRSLNRRMNRLESIVSKIRDRYPGLKVCLLVNEGCIYQCPFKKAHDAHISLSNTGLVPERNHDLARNFGCRRTYEDIPTEILKSPFIRPEDVASYRHVADVFKICGRTLGASFLEQTVSAYLKGAYQGNLLDLMDTTSYLAPSIYIDNDGLPEDFADRVTTCDLECNTCGFCERVFEQCARPNDLKLPRQNI